ncbi:ATP-binding cassette domain-containing protein [Mycoplasmatota bacterium]|nr:ATP-binding cassette domain-containing protein [Mycoplasmatota bacterium]
MKEIILKTHNITKNYSGTAAVKSFNMTIYKGDIYGLIGRNGAGKTTLSRIITGLSIPDTGSITLFGKQSQSELNYERKRIGCVIETPALYNNLTATQNLEYYRIQRGIPDKKVIIRALEMVDLTNTGKKKFKNFSMGMKQRLGLALALLNNPDFIILDEPINGLDPMGIVEMRKTIIKLNQDYGITILISSHILKELYLVATRYGIIDNGKLIKELNQDELNEECQKALLITVDDTANAAAVLETVLKTNKFKVISQNEIKVYDYLDNPSEVTFQFNEAGIRVSSINEIGDNLENYFITQVGEV